MSGIDIIPGLFSGFTARLHLTMNPENELVRVSLRFVEEHATVLYCTAMFTNYQLTINTS